MLVEGARDSQQETLLSFIPFIRRGVGAELALFYNREPPALWIWITGKMHLNAKTWMLGGRLSWLIECSWRTGFVSPQIIFPNHFLIFLKGLGLLFYLSLGSIIKYVWLSRETVGSQDYPGFSLPQTWLQSGTQSLPTIPNPYIFFFWGKWY